VGPGHLIEAEAVLGAEARLVQLRSHTDDMGHTKPAQPEHLFFALDSAAQGEPAADARDVPALLCSKLQCLRDIPDARAERIILHGAPPLHRCTPPWRRVYMHYITLLAIFIAGLVCICNWRPPMRGWRGACVPLPPRAAGALQFRAACMDVWAR